MALIFPGSLGSTETAQRTFSLSLTIPETRDSVLIDCTLPPTSKKMLSRYFPGINDAVSTEYQRSKLTLC